MEQTMQRSLVVSITAVFLRLTTVTETVIYFQLVLHSKQFPAHLENDGYER